MAKLSLTTAKRWLGSETFFRLIVALLVVQAAWIALSSRYAMAFDENFHLGIIQIYAQHWLPFLNHQPAGADAFGPVARDPSYLYQYLMSFPYRLVRLFTHDQKIIVLWLRAINITLLASSLPLWRRVLTRLDGSKALTHICLLIFVLLPVVPLLAAQINYDNLMIPIVAGILLLTLRFNDNLRAKKPLPITMLVLLTIACLLASLIKYPFLPIFGAIIIYVTIRLRAVEHSWSQLGRNLLTGIRRLPTGRLILLVVGLILSLGLFSQRYVVNFVDYHDAIPDCAHILTVQQCQAYGPWNRDYYLAQHKTDPTRSPLSFTADWFYGMWLRSLFAVAGPSNDFQTRGPLFLPAYTAIIAPAAAFLAALIYGRRLWRRYDQSVMLLFALVAGLYLVTLWLDEYRSFLRTGVSVAINGRYLFLVLPLLLVFGAMALREALVRRPRLQLLVGGLVIVGLAWGGGALTYVIRSNPGWYWPDTPMTRLNHDIQTVLDPIVPGSHSPTAFLSHN